MKAFNIKWDLSECMNEQEENDYIRLPKEVFVPNEVWDERVTDIEDIADWLSDEYGFCVDSFELANEEEVIICPYCNGEYIFESKNGLSRCLECGNEF